MVNEKDYLKRIPESAKAEFIFLYNLGIKEDELEYLIRIKSREAFNSETS